MASEAFMKLGDYLDLLLDAICVVNVDHEFTYVSKGAKRVFGYAPDAMIGHSMFEFMHPDDHDATRDCADAINDGGEVIHFENRYIHRNGDVVYLQWSARWSPRDQVRVGVARNITAQKQLEFERLALIEKLEALALTDPLTGLPNRVLFHDRLETARAHATRDGHRLGLLYLDVDRFKDINDALGHSAGDAVLQEVSRRIGAAVREVDTVARLGGDEFVVLVQGVGHRGDILTVAEKVRDAMLPPLVLERREECIRASIGTAMWPEDGEDVDTLLRVADRAMYRAKHSGGNRVS